MLILKRIVILVGCLTMFYLSNLFLIAGLIFANLNLVVEYYLIGYLTMFYLSLSGKFK